MPRIKDGTSNTIAIGESRQLHTSTAYGPYWGAGTHTAVHGRTVNPTNSAGYQWVPNYPYGACSGSTTMMCHYAWGFGSWHTGITNFVFCDGSVRSVADQVSAATWLALGSAGGGEAITDSP